MKEMRFFYVIKAAVKFLQGTASIKSEEVTVLVRFSSRTTVRQVRVKNAVRGDLTTPLSEVSSL